MCTTKGSRVKLQKSGSVYFFPLDIFKHFQICLKSRCGLILGKVPLLKLGLLVWPSFELKMAGHDLIFQLIRTLQILANSES